MSHRLYRSTKTGDLEMFSSDPGAGSGWQLIGDVSAIGGAERQQLLDQQTQLAARERRQHGQLLQTRNTLDELANKLDVLDALAPYDPTNFAATPEKILAAKLRAEGKLPVPCEPPPQESKAVKLTNEEFLALFEGANKKRRGEL